MSSKEQKTSTLLKTLYGDDYCKILGIECISFDHEKGRRTHIMVLKVFAFLLSVFNVALTLWLYEPINLFIFFTQWAVCASLALAGLALVCSLDPDINEKKGRLALIHILCEISTAFNIVALVTYWPFIHKYALELCYGEE